VSLKSKYTGLILASGVKEKNPALALTEVLAPFAVTILESSLLTIRDRAIFSILIELSPDHQAAIAADLDARASAGDLDIGYEFSPFVRTMIEQKRFHCTVVAERFSPNIFFQLCTNIAQNGNLERFSIDELDEISIGEISFTSIAHFDNIKSEMQRIARAEKVTLIIEEEHNRVVGNDACLLDMDSTFINEEVIDILADIAGVGPEVSLITEQAMRGELDFSQSLMARVALLKGQPISIFAQARARLTATVGATELVNALHHRGSKVGVVSGGFHDVIDEFLAPYELDFILANRFEINQGLLTGNVLGEIVDRDRKRAALNEFSQGSQRSIAIGDGANDIAMVTEADLGIAFVAKEALNNVADCSIYVRDLRAVLPILGY